MGSDQLVADRPTTTTLITPLNRQFDAISAHPYVSHLTGEFGHIVNRYAKGGFSSLRAEGRTPDGLSKKADKIEEVLERIRDDVTATEARLNRVIDHPCYDRMPRGLCKQINDILAWDHINRLGLMHMKKVIERAEDELTKLTAGLERRRSWDASRWEFKDFQSVNPEMFTLLERPIDENTDLGLLQIALDAFQLWFDEPTRRMGISSTPVHTPSRKSRASARRRHSKQTTDSSEVQQPSGKQKGKQPKGKQKGK